MANNFQEKANFIWQVADDILRGTFKPHEYGDVILPFVVLRRLDMVLETQKDAVIKQYEQFKGVLDEERLMPILRQAAGELNFYNHSFYDLRRLAQDAKNIELNFNNYINGYSKNVREIIENFQLEKIISKLAKNDLLYQLVEMFAEVDLSPANVTNHEMGYIFEELLRRFSEMSNETAGEHYTPREVIRLMVSLLFAEHKAELQGKGIIRSVYDPACGTGGMLITAKEYIQQEVNPDLEVVMYGQELNEQTYAIAKSDVLIMGENAENIRQGNSFTQDKFKGQRFSYMLSNPPFGVSWAKEENFIKNEANDPHGRFHAGTPRSSDGALLFLQHMISKMEATGSRIAIIFNRSPLLTGQAGSGESEIRKWIIESDMLEAVISLPPDIFYNAENVTFIWVVTNEKNGKRRGKVQLINGVEFYEKLIKPLGKKKRRILDSHIQKITELFTEFADNEYSKVFENIDFGYTTITIETPLLENEIIILDYTSKPLPNKDLRDTENIPLRRNISEYFEHEIKPFSPTSWLDRTKDKIGYEIPITEIFHKNRNVRFPSDIARSIDGLREKRDTLYSRITKEYRRFLPSEISDSRYKDSWLTWLEKIPSNWSLLKAKYIFKRVNRPPRDFDETVTAFRDGVVTLRSNRRTEGFTEAIQEAGYQGVRKGDLVIHAMDAAAGAIGVSDSEGKCSPVYVICVPIINSCTHYYAYILRRMAIGGFLESLSKGVRVRSTDFRWADFKELLLPVPPYEEQLEIVNFLQNSDRLIQIEREIYDLIKEYQSSLIFHVVKSKTS